MKNLGKNLRYYRKLRRLSQKELAERVGISTEFIKAIESRNTAPRLINFVKICEVLNIPSDFLLKDDNKISEIYAIDLLMQEFDRYSDEERQFYVEILNRIIGHKSLGEPSE